MRTVLEWLFALLGAAAVVVFFVLIRVDLLQSPGELWPFPGLYLVEIALLALLALAGVALRQRGSAAAGSTMIWLSAGALAGLALMGLFSIGKPLLPAVLAFIAAGLAGTRSLRRELILSLGFFLLALLGQAALMFGLMTGGIS